MCLVAMNTATKQRVDLADKAAAGFVKTLQDWCTAHGGIALLGH